MKLRTELTYTALLAVLAGCMVGVNAATLQIHNWSGTNVVVGGFQFPSGAQGTLILPDGNLLIYWNSTNFVQSGVMGAQDVTFGSDTWDMEPLIGYTGWFLKGFGFAAVLCIGALAVRLIKQVGRPSADNL